MKPLFTLIDKGLTYSTNAATVEPPLYICNKHTWMKSLRSLALLPAILFLYGSLLAQPAGLKTGFHSGEYEDLLFLNSMFYKDSLENGKTVGKEQVYRFVYRSPEMGLKNKWDLWLREDRTAVISIRGTVQHASSWMENFYAAMVPAQGDIKINATETFRYKLAADPKATVHAGWTVGLAHLAPDMTEKIRGLMEENKISALIITGHSQGGALAFLATSYFYYLSESGGLPGKIPIKAYCSAAPKPGNLYYAYDFDYITRNGMAFNVINGADWVPETPPSVQTFSDINPTNPFNNATTLLGKQKWPANWYLNSVYKKLKRTPDKTLHRYEKYFGHKIYGQVRKTLPGLQEPSYAGSSNYMRAGSPVVLMPDKEYFQKFQDTTSNIFIHHMYEPYLFLLHRIYGQPGEKNP
jgi:hypothetical protein